MNLKRHLESIHEGIKHSCDVSGKQFTTKSIVTSHNISVHMISVNLKQLHRVVLPHVNNHNMKELSNFVQCVIKGGVKRDP